MGRRGKSVDNWVSMWSRAHSDYGAVDNSTVTSEPLETSKLLRIIGRRRKDLK
jgi:hypothetical protein